MLRHFEQVVMACFAVAQRRTAKCAECGIPLSPERKEEARATGSALCHCCQFMLETVKSGWFRFAQMEWKADLEEAKIQKHLLMNPDEDEDEEGTRSRYNEAQKTRTADGLVRLPHSMAPAFI